MATVILRRSSDNAASPDEAQRLVVSLNASVKHSSDQTLLVNVGSEAQVDELRGKLPGWVVSLQGPKIPVPDTRLKVKSAR